jgi:hypothetical protein
MSNDNNIKTFTAADIEKYHTRQLSPKEMHDLEKAALDDPFLADALEGYAVTGVNVAADIADLKKRLAEKTEQAKVIPIGTAGTSSFPWLRAAVMIVLIAGAGLLSYQFLFKTKSEDIAQAPQKENDLAKTKEPVTIQPQLNNTDSSSLVPSTPASSDKTKKEFASVEQKNETKVATGSAGAVTESANGELVTADAKKSLPVTTTVPSRADEFKKTEEVTARQETINAQKADIAAKDYSKSRNLVDNKTPASADFTRKEEKEVVVAGVNAKQNNQGLYRNNNSNNNAANLFRGRVTDANNNALPFANVTNTTDNVGTYSDAKGYFTLVSPDSVLDVQVRSLGFENNRIQLRNNVPTNQIAMQEDRSITAKVLDTVKRNYALRSKDGNLTFEEPEPADGWASYDTYLANNLNLPEKFDVKKNTANDAVELSFEVNKDGEPVNIRVEKSLCDKCDKEAIRLVKEGPKWKRKAKKGKRTTVTIPFVKTD